VEETSNSRKPNGAAVAPVLACLKIPGNKCNKN